jgi:hypothetical protein
MSGESGLLVIAATIIANAEEILLETTVAASG